jgi:hypothetical protein
VSDRLQSAYGSYGARRTELQSRGISRP